MVSTKKNRLAGIMNLCVDSGDFKEALMLLAQRITKHKSKSENPGASESLSQWFDDWETEAIYTKGNEGRGNN